VFSLLTTLTFVLVTGLFVAVHVARGRKAATAAAKSCPRCKTRIVEGQQWCPGCRAPLQAFELVTAKVVTGPRPAADGPLHAIVRADVCVGCGTCVAACPEPGAIQLVNKIAKVDLDKCKGHASCAAACPVSAIVVTSGAAVQTIEVPDLTPNFESKTVPGIYVVGELGGRGLIKNAVNEGRLAMENVARSLERNPSRGDTTTGVYDVIVVGAGPAGISAGLEAIHQGLRYAILEQGTIADTIAKYPRKKLLFAEPLRVPIYGELWVSDGSKEALLKVWQAMIDQTGLQVRTHHRVDAVEKTESVIRIKSGDRLFRTRRAILAMGRRGTPRRLGVPGEELDKVLYDIVEMEAFAGQRMLVVGGGDSAVESALGLANQAGTTVTLSYRGDAFGRVKDRNREKIEAAVNAGKVKLLMKSELREIHRDAVVLDYEGAARRLPNDVVVVRIGGEAPYPFLERIGVRIVQKELALEPEVGARAG
jgi:putative YpdA family bacillithiol system oxidoreductase